MPIAPNVPWIAGVLGIGSASEISGASMIGGVLGDLRDRLILASSVASVTLASCN